MPRSGGAALPGRDVFAALPRSRLVQLLSAGAENFAGRLPDGVLLCNARGAHTPATAEWAVTATLAAQRGIPSFVREQGAGRWSPATHRSLVGASPTSHGRPGTGSAPWASSRTSSRTPTS